MYVERIEESDVEMEGMIREWLCERVGLRVENTFRKAVGSWALDYLAFSCERS
jgi:hypothetical protein